MSQTAAPAPQAAIAVEGFENLYQMAASQFTRAADTMNLDKDLRVILSQPKNEIIVNFPVRMDNGSYQLFKGYRIQHNNILGCYKGGIRYHPQVHPPRERGERVGTGARTAAEDRTGPVRVGEPRGADVEGARFGGRGRPPRYAGPTAVSRQRSGPSDPGGPS